MCGPSSHHSSGGTRTRGTVRDSEAATCPREDFSHVSSWACLPRLWGCEEEPWQCGGGARPPAVCVVVTAVTLQVTAPHILLQHHLRLPSPQLGHGEDWTPCPGRPLSVPAESELQGGPWGWSGRPNCASSHGQRWDMGAQVGVGGKKSEGESLKTQPPPGKCAT